MSSGAGARPGPTPGHCSNGRRRCSRLPSDDSCEVHRAVILRLGVAPDAGDGCRRGVGLASSWRRKPAILLTLHCVMAVARHDPLRASSGCSGRCSEGGRRGQQWTCPQSGG